MQIRRWMQTAFFVFAGFLVLLNSRSATGQTSQPDSAHQPEPRVLAKVAFDGVPLEEVLAFLHDQDPDFQAVIAHSQNGPDDYPVVSLKLTNVTADEVLHVIEMEYNRVMVQSTETNASSAFSSGGGTGGGGRQSGDQNRIYVVTLQSPQVVMGPGGQVIIDGKETQTQHVIVYNLSSLVEAMGRTRKPMDDAAAMKNILEVVKAVCDELPQDPRVAIQVHEATHVLIVKGSDEQQNAVNGAIAALQPPAPDPNEAGDGADKLAHLRGLEDFLEDRKVKAGDMNIEMKMLEQNFGPGSEQVKNAGDKLNLMKQEEQEAEDEVNKLRAEIKNANGGEHSPGTPPSKPQ